MFTSGDNLRLDEAYTRFDQGYNGDMAKYLDKLVPMGGENGAFAQLPQRVADTVRAKTDQLFGKEALYQKDPTRANTILGEIYTIIDKQNLLGMSPGDNAQTIAEQIAIGRVVKKIETVRKNFADLATNAAERIKEFPPRLQTMVQQRYNAAAGNAVTATPRYEIHPVKLREVTKEVYFDFYNATRMNPAEQHFSDKSRALIEKTQQETRLEFAAAAKKAFENFEKYDDVQPVPSSSSTLQKPAFVNNSNNRDIFVQPSRDGSFIKPVNLNNKKVSESADIYNPFVTNQNSSQRNESIVRREEKTEDYNPFAKSTSSSQRIEPTVRQKEKKEDYNPFAKNTSSSQRNESTVRQKEKTEDYNPFAKSTSSSQRIEPAVRQKEKNEDYNPFAKNTSSSQRNKPTVKQREQIEDYNPFAKDQSFSQKSKKAEATINTYNPFSEKTSSNVNQRSGGQVVVLPPPSAQKRQQLSNDDIRATYEQGQREGRAEMWAKMHPKPRDNQAGIQTEMKNPLSDQPGQLRQTSETMNKFLNS